MASVFASRYRRAELEIYRKSPSGRGEDGALKGIPSHIIRHLAISAAMLSIFASNGSMVEEATLQRWLDYIVKDKSSMKIKSAALVYLNGNVAAATSSFRMSTDDFKTVKRSLLDKAVETMKYGGVTYCLRSRSATQAVWFNGRNYIVTNRTELTIIITHCQSRQKCDIVSVWVNKVADKLRQRHT